MKRNVHRLEKEKIKYFRSLSKEERFLKAVELSELALRFRKSRAKRNKKTVKLLRTSGTLPVFSKRGSWVKK